MPMLREGVVHTETDYGTALLDERSGRYWTLNPTGTFVLRLLLDGRTTTEVSDAVANRYNVDTTAAGRDVRALLTQLHAVGLLVADRAS
ncbi:lasso peptide biosynthesis PqqD family chaperone [Frankia sp. Cppng1_Ct_nod]|uniref:lasso peptide biosynthesis PqqD family chaperone n=1 Tax=Frankia sp. Cppng1_Ct_nod TaxID=2897162 RepID=UPI0010419B79|nr:lasso peptide biosynthesis PqqD family chaperone [Frankia sp. Cppng1_Ct_nod]